MVKTYSIKLGDETLATASQVDLENVERSGSACLPRRLQERSDARLIIQTLVLELTLFAFSHLEIVHYDDTGSPRLVLPDLFPRTP